MMRFATAAALTVATTMPVWADAESAALFEALMLPEIIEVMHKEGLDYGAEIGADLFGGAPSSDWTRIVAHIYDVDHMTARAQADFEAALAGEDLVPMLEFFSSERGQQIVTLEVSAREAMLDDAVEEAAKEFAAIASADETARFAQIEEFVSINDLIETNVVGAMNSNVAFFMGLADGGAFEGELTEDQILSDVWSQEGEIRQNTAEWVYSFLMLAYQPLSDEDLDAYIAFSRTPEGQVLNRALFVAFDGLFVDISRALGLASADQMTAQEL